MAQQATSSTSGAQKTFDAERHRPRTTPLTRLAAWIFGSHWFWRLLRTVWPIPRVAGWALVSRYDDVAEVFSRHDVFRVPFREQLPAHHASMLTAAFTP